MNLNISCICCPLNSVIRCCITWFSCNITGTKMVWYWLLQFFWLVSNRKIYTHFVFQWCNVAHGIRHTLTSVFFWTTTPKSALDHEHVWHQALIVTKVCWPFLSPPSLVFVWAFAILGSYEAEEKFGVSPAKLGTSFRFPSWLRGATRIRCHLAATRLTVALDESDRFDERYWQKLWNRLKRLA